jgi:hypothetical protein
MELNTLLLLLNKKDEFEPTVLAPDRSINAARIAINSNQNLGLALNDLNQQASELRQTCLLVELDQREWPENWQRPQAERYGAELHSLRGIMLKLLNRSDEAREALLAACAYTAADQNTRQWIYNFSADLPEPQIPVLTIPEKENLYAVYRAELSDKGQEANFVPLEFKEHANDYPGFSFDNWLMPYEIFKASVMQNRGISQEIAAASLKRTVEILEPGGPSRLLAESKICLSRTLGKAAKADDRIIFAVEGVEILQALNTEKGLGRGILAIATAMEEKGWFGDALRSLELAIASLIKTGDAGAIAMAYYRQAVMARKIGVFALAIKFLDRSAAMAATIIPDEHFLGQLYSEYVHDFLEIGLTEQALFYIGLYITQNPLHYFGYLRRASVHAFQKQLNAAHSDYRKAVFYYVAEQSRTKSDHFSSANRNYEDSVFQEAIWFCCNNGFKETALELLLLAHAGNINNSSLDWKKKTISPEIKDRAIKLAMECFNSMGKHLPLEKLHRTAEFLIAEGDIITPSGIANPNALINDLDIITTARNKIGDNSCLIASAMLKDDIWIFYLTKEKLEYRRSELSIKSWKELCKGFDGSLTSYGALENLLADMMLPLENYGSSITSILFSLDPLTYGVPFHALRYNGKFLCTFYQVSYLTSIWDFLQDNAVQIDTTAKPAIFCACPVVSYNTNFSKLYLEDEREEFFDLFPDMQEINETDAFFQVSLQQLGILYFACHGYYDSERPLFSSLLLNDRPLYAFEIMLSGLKSDVVFINACDTAGGKLLAGGYIRNLAAAFIRSGVTNVIAALWPVTDFSADFFIRLFYRNIKSGCSVAYALNKARLEMLEVPTYSDPQLWAPYILYGSGND